VHVIQLATNPLYVPVDVDEVAVHETHSVLVVSQTNPEAHSVQDKTLTARLHCSQLDLNPVYVTVPEFTPDAQLTQTLSSSSNKYPASVSQSVHVIAITVTEHEVHPTKFPVYPVVASVQETQTLLVESQAYPSLHSSQAAAVQWAQLAI
jgi:hypothetical protein